MLLMTASAANAGLVTKHASSVQLTVDAARTTATRIGSSFTSRANIDTTDGSTAGAVSAGTITSGVYNPGTITATQDTAGSAFSFSQSYTQGDAVPTSAATVGTVPNFSSTTSYASEHCWRSCRYCSNYWSTYRNRRRRRFFCYWTVRFRNYCYRLMTRLQEAISLGLVLGVIHGLLQPAYSVPVVPNFTHAP